MKNKFLKITFTVFSLVILLVVVDYSYFALSNSISNCSAINNPNGTDFSWNEVNSDKELKTCLLELAKNLESTERMAEWLTQQGFSDVGLVSNTPNRSYLNALWNTELSGSGIPFSGNLSFIDRIFVWGKNYSVQVTYENGIPVSTNAGHLVL